MPFKEEDTVNEEEHFQRLRKYYESSKPVYDFLLWGSKHCGFYPNEKSVSEREAQSLMKDLVGRKLRLTSKMRVLEAGSGEGAVSTYLSKKHGCSMEGITMVPFEIKRADAKAQRLGVSDRVRFSVMDYSHTTFPDNHFGAIYTCETLVHSPDVRATLREFFRLLKKGGRVALFEYTLADDSDFSEQERDNLNKVCETAVMPGLKEIRNSQFEELLKDVGFRNITTEDITENVAPSVYRLKRFFVVPYFFVSLFHLQERFPNLMGVIEFTKMGEKRLMSYNIFTAEK